MQELYNFAPGEGVFLLTVWVVVRAPPQPVLGVIEHATWACGFDLIPKFVEPDPIGNPVAENLQEGTFVPVRHFSVLQVSTNIVPVELDTIVDEPGFQQVLLVSFIRDAVEIVDDILAEHGW